MATKVMDREAREPRRRASNASSARRAQLLQIAAELFATRGYSQTTVRDIADEAGILSGSLYHHFASKETMLTEILQTFLGGLLENYRRIVEEETRPREALDQLVRASFEAIHRSQHAVALYQHEAALLVATPEFAFVGKLSLDVERIWLSVLRAGVESGDLRDDLDIKVTYRFIRDGAWSTVRWYNPRGRLRHGVLADQFLEMIHGGLLAG